MKILLLEPFLSGSHEQWARGVAAHSGHEVRILSLPGKFWKWRMHGGAHSLSQQFLQDSFEPDLILASDMLDLPLFLALTRTRTARIPVALYFHENQLVYPWSPTDEDVEKQRDRHYAFINFSSARVADHVFFNSHFHLNSFFKALPGFLHAFPDHKELSSIEEIRAKSDVLPLGLDLAFFDRFRIKRKQESRRPVFLWNHRWEYDKNPEAFFEALFQVKDLGYDFGLIVLGEQYQRNMPVFSQAKEKLAAHIIHWGYAKHKEEYARLLCQSDIYPVTSHHDFFGISVVEAIYTGAYPLLPNRLSYPEHIPSHLHTKYLYKDSRDLLAKLIGLLDTETWKDVDREVADWVSAYGWQIQGSKYRERLGTLG